MALRIENRFKLLWRDEHFPKEYPWPFYKSWPYVWKTVWNFYNVTNLKNTLDPFTRPGPTSGNFENVRVVFIVHQNAKICPTCNLLTWKLWKYDRNENQNAFVLLLLAIYSWESWSSWNIDFFSDLGLLL